MNIIIADSTKGIESNATTALIASELRFQKEVDKATLVQKKFQQEAGETIVGLGQEIAQLKVALVASEGSKKEVESLNKAKEKALQEENEKLKEENKQLKDQATSLMQQVEEINKEKTYLMEFYTLLRARYYTLTREQLLARAKKRGLLCIEDQYVR